MKIKGRWCTSASADTTRLAAADLPNLSRRAHSGEDRLAVEHDVPRQLLAPHNSLERVSPVLIRAHFAVLLNMKYKNKTYSKYVSAYY